MNFEERNKEGGKKEKGKKCNCYLRLYFARIFDKWGRERLILVFYEVSGCRFSYMFKIDFVMRFREIE